MFCRNCGTQMLDGAGFCPTCGTKQKYAIAENTNYMFATNNSVNRKKSRNNKGLVGIGAVAIIGIILLVTIFVVRGPEVTAKKYIKLRLEGEYLAADKLFPDKFVDYKIDLYCSDKSEYTKTVESHEEVIKEANKDRGFKIDYINTEVEYNLTNSEIQEIEEYYEDEYDFKLNIKEAKEIEVKVKYEYAGETLKPEESVLVIKVGTRWYIAPGYAQFVK